jgi:hypothetical protein
MLEWLKYLNRELDQPDKWAGMFESSSQIGWTPDERDNVQFTYVEVHEIETAISRVKVGMQDLGLAKEQINIMEAKLDYVTERAKTVGKVDWKNLFIGTMISTIVQLALPPETGHALWLLLREAFKKVLLISLG